MRTAAQIGISVLFLTAAGIVLWWRSDLSALQSIPSSFHLVSFLQIFVLMFAGGLLAGWRMKIISAEFGVALSHGGALSLYAGSTIIGAFLFQFFGQALTRAVWFSRRGHPHSIGVLTTLYEKGTAAAISVLMAIIGALYLFHRLSFNVETGGADLIKIGVGLTCVFVAACAIGWGSQLRSIFTVRLHDLVSLGKICLLSIGAQVATMAAYVCPSLILDPSIPLPDVIAATSLVMLAASIPISFVGWGLREISAIAAMGSIGLSPQHAFFAAILVGVASHLALVCVALSGMALSNAAATQSEKVSIVTAAPKIDYDQALGWAVPVCVAMAVFFHLHVPLSAGMINVNLADPIAIIGAGMFLAKRFGKADEQPTWSFGHLEICAALATIVLGFAVLHGLLLIGPTDWAIMNKFVGWFVLLSYACSGALIVNYGGYRGLVTLLLTFAAAGAAVALFDILSSVVDHPAQRLTGFAQNPNAFGFEMLLVAVCILALANLMPASCAMLSIVFAATWLSGSRAVVLAWPFTIAAAWSMRIVSLRLLARSIVFAAITCLAVGIAWMGLEASTDQPGIVVGVLTGLIGASAQSDSEHLATVVDGLRLFAGSPIFGAGIGVYVQQHLGQALEFPVIHSTMVWLLAETGVVGLLVFVASFAGLLVTAWRRRDSNDISAQIIVPALVAFAITSLVHELLYQRPLWFLLGATAAVIKTRQSVTGVVSPGLTTMVSPVGPGTEPDKAVRPGDENRLGGRDRGMALICR